MKKKQILCLILACALFIVTGVSSVLSHKAAENQTSMWDDVLYQMTSGASQIPVGDFYAVIDIYGTIQAVPDTSTDLLSGATISYDHSYYMELVNILMTTDNCMGIILDVDSPGGTVYESDEFYLKLMEYKDVTGKPIYAYFRSTACSGAYYIAMAADKVYANRNCTTGSIGVIMSTYNLAGLFDKVGIEEVLITSGENKGMGSIGSEMTEGQLAIYQSVVDESYEQFVNIVATGRNMDVVAVKALADGRIYTANQALQAGLIDEICGAEGFYNIMNQEAPCYDLSYSGANDFWSMLFATANNFKTTAKTEAQVTLEWISQFGSGVPMYVNYGK